MSAFCVFFVGGTRSGKSGMAQRWAEAVAPQRLYLATCRAEDEEMTRRVARHQHMRGAGWQCIEEPLDPAAALDRLFAAAQANGACASQNTLAAGLPEGSQTAVPGVILLDCVSLWIANLLARDQDENTILCKVSALGERLVAPPLPVAVVSAETGLGLVPMSPLGRAFNDVLGLANQELARVCRHVIFVSCGLPLALKGALPEDLC
ncbi:MAG: bifunctional adenosylcobinamide kinase/adenosylcobinamide-phosphate guanylyltransferase [Desulfovibrio sp.]|nr:bifunctional adenosylcobinamide kinase/adenosylcobinamide-phosphate guanylyltransferase [Desulfovibrio sp.]